MSDLEYDVSTRSREYERLFCASAMIDIEIAIAQCSWLSETDFYEPKYAKFWGIVKQGNAEPVKVAFDLEIEDDLLEAMGNIPPMSQENYAQKVSEYSFYRKSMSSVKKIVTAIGARKADDIRSLAANLGSENPSGVIDAIFPEQLDFEFRTAINEQKLSINTFIGQFDQVIGGLFPKELIVLAARPGMGKTSIVLQMARNIAVSGKRVLFFSLEMSRIGLWARMACPNAGLEWKNVRSGNVLPQQLANLEIESVDLAAKLGDRLIIQDNAFTLEEIHQSAIRYKPDIVFVDQLPDIHWPDPAESEVRWYGLACKYLIHYIAKNLDVPVVLVHQLNREVEGRQDKRPSLSDLRFSGEVEQRADIVLMLYRDDYYTGRQQGVNSVVTELWIKKNRQGEMSSCVFLNYDLKKQWFT